MKNQKQHSWIKYTKYYLDSGKYLLGGLLLFIGLWSVSKWDSETSNKTRLNKKGNAKDLVAKKTENEKFQEYDEEEEKEEEEEEISKRQEVRAEKEKEVFVLYNQNETEEEIKVRELLEQFDLTFEEINQFPVEELENLDENELSLLRKYQGKQEITQWAKREIERFENVDFEKRARVSKHRLKLLKKGKELEKGLVAKLSDPYLSISVYKETALILSLSGTSRSFPALNFLYQKETDLKKKKALLAPIARLGKLKGLPLLIKALEDPNPEMVSNAISLLELASTIGAEPFLEKLLDKKNKEIVATTVEALKKINSVKANEILKNAEKEGKILVLTTD